MEVRTSGLSRLFVDDPYVTHPQHFGVDQGKVRPNLGDFCYLDRRNLSLRYGVLYMGTSLTRNCFLLGPHRRPTPRLLQWA